MLSRRAKRIILAIGLFHIILIVVLIALPNVVLAIPGRYRVALAEQSPFLSDLTEGLIEQVAPVAEFLPAPETAVEIPRITIPSIKPTVMPQAMETSLHTATAAESSGELLTADLDSTPEPTPTQTPLPIPTSTPAP
ncbi:MAG TPA: hypothetical protein VFI27_17750, partial [candidate division Zixibacteria bacterium]|nr:hypothetical protein [candidate division Zixibacteria bacterium]